MFAISTFLTEKLDLYCVVIVSIWHIFAYSSSPLSDPICVCKILQTKMLRGMSPLTVSISSIKRCGIEIAIETFLSHFAALDAPAVIVVRSILPINIFN
jgi:hypothetical protein